MCQAIDMRHLYSCYMGHHCQSAGVGYWKYFRQCLILKSESKNIPQLTKLCFKFNSFATITCKRWAWLVLSYTGFLTGHLSYNKRDSRAAISIGLDTSNSARVTQQRYRVVLSSACVSGIFWFLRLWVVQHLCVETEWLVQVIFFVYSICSDKTYISNRTYWVSRNSQVNNSCWVWEFDWKAL